MNSASVIYKSSFIVQPNPTLFNKKKIKQIADQHTSIRLDF